MARGTTSCRLPDAADRVARPATRRAGPLLVAAGLLVLPPLHGATAADPTVADWPCVQVLVPQLAASQMWAGPPAEALEDSAATDGETAQLAHQLASRSVPLEEAQAAIDRFAEGLAPEERNAGLAHLFHDVLALINQERSQIIAGIERYTRKQRRLAAKIAQDSRRLGNLQPGTEPDAQTQELLDARQWDLRVFEDRKKVLRQICEQPVLLDQRAFALARAIQARLEPM